MPKLISVVPISAQQTKRRTSDLLIERQNNMQQIVVPLTVERINWLQTGEQRLNVAEFTTTNRDRLLCVGYT